MSINVEPARSSSDGPAVVLRNCIGEGYPSAECGRSGIVTHYVALETRAAAA